MVETPSPQQEVATRHLYLGAAFAAPVALLLWIAVIGGILWRL